MPALSQVHRVGSAIYPLDPFLGHLVAAMEKKGCDITPEFYTCRPCSLPVEGLYDSKLGVSKPITFIHQFKVVLCENNVLPPQIREVMLHETIHAYDYCRAKVDDSDCSQIACAEVNKSFRPLSLPQDPSQQLEWPMFLVE